MKKGEIKKEGRRRDRRSRRPKKAVNKTGLAGRKKMSGKEKETDSLTVQTSQAFRI